MKSPHKLIAAVLAASTLAVGAVAVGTDSASAYSSSSTVCKYVADFEAWTGSTTTLVSVPTRSATKLDCYLRYGDGLYGNKNDGTWNAVMALQDALNTCYGANLSVDGKFGTKTRDALKAAQKKMGVKADGIFGYGETMPNMLFPESIIDTETPEDQLGCYKAGARA
jgi:hypothetical protein